MPQVVAIAHKHGVPVLVDAAAQIPPISSLWHFTHELGADIAIFSGGKGLRGPQSSGLVLGRRDIIAACRVNGSPNHSLGRPMKVGKEEMLGILAAVEWSLAQDEEATLAGYEATVQRWIAGLRDLPGVTVERGYPSEAGQPHAAPSSTSTPDAPMTRDQVVAALYGGTPCVAVGTVGTDAIALNPQTLATRAKRRSCSIRCAQCWPRSPFASSKPFRRGGSRTALPATVARVILWCERRGTVERAVREPPLRTWSISSRCCNGSVQRRK